MVTIDLEGNLYSFKNELIDLNVEEYLSLVDIQLKKEERLIAGELVEVSAENESMSFSIERGIKMIALLSDIPQHLITPAVYLSLSEYENYNYSILEPLNINSLFAAFTSENRNTLYSLKEMSFVQFVDFMTCVNTDNICAAVSIALISPLEYDSSIAMKYSAKIKQSLAYKYINTIYHIAFKEYRSILKNSFPYILDAEPSISSSSNTFKTSEATRRFNKVYSWASMLVDLASKSYFGGYEGTKRAKAFDALAVLNIEQGRQFCESEDYKLNEKNTR